MKIVCAWCGKDMGEKDGKGVEGVSHSICKRCLAKLTTKVESNTVNKSKWLYLSILTLMTAIFGLVYHYFVTGGVW